MNRLQTELHRLYLPQTPDGSQAATGEAGQVHAGSRVHAMMLELARPAGWQALSALWRGVQTDLELPAPAIAVNGTDGYQLWFSFAEPVPVAQAQDFLDAVRTRYLEGIAAERIRQIPARDAGTDPGVHDTLPPARQHTTGRWSAFVLPDLAAVFADDPWLDLAPNPQAQADLLARMASIQPAAFQQALDRLSPATPTATQGTGAQRPPGVAPADPGPTPRQFLLAVMNDPGVDLPLRMEAAKALLPYG